jgi:hypothetical protein
LVLVVDHFIHGAGPYVYGPKALKFRLAI